VHSVRQQAVKYATERMAYLVCGVLRMAGAVCVYVSQPASLVVRAVHVEGAGLRGVGSVSKYALRCV